MTMAFSYPWFNGETDAASHIRSFLNVWNANHVSRGGSPRIEDCRVRANLGWASDPLAFLARHHDLHILQPTLILILTLLRSKHSPTQDHWSILYDQTVATRVCG